MTQREIIIECASKMFVAQGVKAVRMDDIAQELSMSKRTLYELFGDKEELLYQSLLHFLVEGQKRRNEQCRSVENSLEIMLLCLRDMIAYAPVSWRLRTNLKRFYPSVFERLENDAHANSQSDLRRWVKECVASGYFTTTADSELVIRVLQDSVQGIMLVDKFDTVDNVHLVSKITYAIVIFIRGLCTVSGIEVIDRCFDKYFGNIQSIDTL
ncbi:MAG: TetR/AcrR family transcriptional regulator [Alistipes sp.]|nr:TetR/AcrR family transcriptional regulator [Alistipes sp.]